MNLIKYIARTAWTPITMIFLIWLFFDGVVIEISKVITNSVLKFYEFLPEEIATPVSLVVSLVWASSLLYYLCSEDKRKKKS